MHYINGTEYIHPYAILTQGGICVCAKLVEVMLVNIGFAHFRAWHLRDVLQCNHSRCNFLSGGSGGFWTGTSPYRPEENCRENWLKMELKTTLLILLAVTGILNLPVFIYKVLWINGEVKRQGIGLHCWLGGRKQEEGSRPLGPRK